jgi:hypothetical protein
MTAVSLEEVADLLRRLARGEVSASSKADEHWDTQVNFYVMVEGWRLSIFNDADSMDGVYFAEAPDGRHTDIDEWFKEYGKEPQDLLSDEEVNTLEELFRQACRPQKRRPLSPWAPFR